MARMIAERLWMNRFLMWSPVVERITGPGSRMAPGAWLGTSNDRLQFATGVEKPIWLNEFFDWGVWRYPVTGGRWSLDDVEGMVPDLPASMQDVAWRKQFPNDLRCSVRLIPWMNRYPKLRGVSDARPDPMLGEMVNYQTARYAVGSIDQPYEATGCMAYASAWWNDHRAPDDAPLGSPQPVRHALPALRLQRRGVHGPDGALLREPARATAGGWMDGTARPVDAGVRRTGPRRCPSAQEHACSSPIRAHPRLGRRPPRRGQAPSRVGGHVPLPVASRPGRPVRQPAADHPPPGGTRSPATGGSCTTATPTWAFGHWKPPTCAVLARPPSRNACGRSSCIRTTTWARRSTASATRTG